MADGKRRDPYLGMRYRVKIEGFDFLGFASVDGLEKSVNVKEYREGEDPDTVRKLAGLTVYGPITLERGVGPGDKDLENWFDTVSKLDTPPPVGSEMRRAVIIELMDQYRQAVERYEVPQGWPSELKISKFEGTTDDPVIKTFVVTNEGWERTL